MSARNDKEARDSLQFSSLFSDLAREVPDQKARDALLLVIRTACRLDDQVGMLTRIGQAYVDAEWAEDCGSNLLALDLQMLLKHIRDAVSEATDIVSLEADEIARGLVRLAALGAEEPAPPRPLPDSPGAEASPGAQASPGGLEQQLRDELYLLDCLLQESCDAVGALTCAASAFLDAEPSGLWKHNMRVLLEQIQEKVERPTDLVNAAAERYGCNYVAEPRVCGDRAPVPGQA